MNKEITEAPPKMHRRNPAHLPQSPLSSRPVLLWPKVGHLLPRWSQLGKRLVHNLHPEQLQLTHHQSIKAHGRHPSSKLRCQS